MQQTGPCQKRSMLKCVQSLGEKKKRKFAIPVEARARGIYEAQHYRVSKKSFYCQVHLLVNKCQHDVCMHMETDEMHSQYISSKSSRN